jgi:hypothetical protein
MAVIVTRAGKGSPLTNAEVDQNFLNLNAAVVAAPGDVVGPAGATDNFLVRFDGVTGKLLQSSSWQISDPGHLLPGAAGTLDIGSTAVRVHTLFGTTGDFSSQVNSGRLNLNLTGQAPRTPIDGATMMQIDSGAGTRLEFNVFGGGVSYISTRHSRGPPGAPTASVSGDWMASWGARGYGATGYAVGEAATIVARASETWTDTAQGTDIVVGVTPIGQTTISWNWVFQGAGQLEPFYDNLVDIGSAGRRVRNVVAFQGVFSGPVTAGLNSKIMLTGSALNSILYFDTTPAVNAALLYDKGLNQFQFFGPTATLKIDGATGTLRTPGSVAANALAAGPSGMMQIAGTAGVNSVIYFDAVTAGKPAYFTYNFPGNTLDLVLASIHVAAFNPADQSLTVDGTIRALNVTATAAGSGSAVLNPGGTLNSGYLAFFDPTNTRVGYIGFGDTATKTLNFAAEAGYAYRFGSGFSTAGEITFGASFDLVEPRGRYWNRPAPSTSFTLDLNYAGALGVCVSATPTTITIPPQSAVPWKSWTRMDFVQYGAGQVTFAPGAGVTLNATGGKRKTTGPLSAVSLIQINPDEWLLIGDLAL